jgi:hypothetical protein
MPDVSEISDFGGPEWVVRYKLVQRDVATTALGCTVGVLPASLEVCLPAPSIIERVPT